MAGKIHKVLLTQPNYSFFGKRSWQMLPYSLGLLNACLKKRYITDIYDPNFLQHNEEQISDFIINFNADVVAISTISTDYAEHIRLMTELVRKVLPSAIIIVGGVLPTVLYEDVWKDANVDFWFFREGEKRFPLLLDEIDKGSPDFSEIEGIAYLKDGQLVINDFIESDGYVYDLDSVPFPDYGSLDILEYGQKKLKFSVQLVAQQYPFAISSTSRGCPFNCSFCSGWTVTGKKVRMRSAENVLEELDLLYGQGFKEIIYLDDHFLFDRQRAIEIMQGIMERNYNLTWKCVNLNIAMLDDEILLLMKNSGCYQIAVAIESGNDEVLKKMIRKPFIDLQQSPKILKKAKDLGFEVIVNFIIGYPDETWEQIRETFLYAEQLEIDYAIFHIATPLPKTELMRKCIENGLLDPADLTIKGFTDPVISTKEFTVEELKILRSFEWDRINFVNERRKRRIAKMQGCSMEELEEWRRNTRRNLGLVKV